MANVLLLIAICLNFTSQIANTFWPFFAALFPFFGHKRDLKFCRKRLSPLIEDLHYSENAVRSFFEIEVDWDRITFPDPKVEEETGYFKTKYKKSLTKARHILGLSAFEVQREKETEFRDLVQRLILTSFFVGFLVTQQTWNILSSDEQWVPTWLQDLELAPLYSVIFGVLALVFLLSRSVRPNYGRKKGSLFFTAIEVFPKFIGDKLHYWYRKLKQWLKLERGFEKQSGFYLNELVSFAPLDDSE